MRPQRRSFIAGTTARVHRNALVRLALTTAIQSLVGDVLERVADLPADAPGAVDQDVDAADPGEEVLDRRGVGEVDVVLVDAVHRRPVAAQRLGDRGADAVRGAGHHRGLAGQAVRRVTGPSRSRAAPAPRPRPASQTTCMSSSGRA